MRRIYPAHDDEPDLEALYAYPPDPWLRANMVASLDGAAQLDGHSGGLSGAADKDLFQLLRGMADVILVGAGTARTEGYGAVPAKRRWQAMRQAAGQPPAPVIAVVSRRLDLDLDGRLFSDALPDTRTVVLTTEAASGDRRRAAAKVGDVIVAGEDRVDISGAVDALLARGARRLLCEGGPMLLAEVVAARRLDELCLTVSPTLSAGRATRILDGPPLPHPAAMRLAHALADHGHLFLRYVKG